MSSILNTIKAGEDSYNEFKNASFHNESLDKEIIAFSNMKSGSI
jgi:ATP-dependent DNA helicase RecG